MSLISTRIASRSDQSAWDTFVQNHPASTPYHLFAWKLAVEEAYKHAGCYLIAEVQGQLKGILPLIHMRLSFLQNQLVSLPFCDLAGPLSESPEIEEALLREAVSVGQKLGCKKIEIRSRQRDSFTVPSEKSKVKGGLKKVSMLLPLPSCSEELWNGFKSKLRSQVRKAEKNGLAFKWSVLPDINAFYHVFSKNMLELGSPVHSKKFIAAIQEKYHNNCRTGLVYKDSIPVGCGIILLCGRTVCIPWASTLREFNRLSPNMLLYWNFLEFAADNGFTLFDFGRSTPEEGTFRFKAQWGATPTPLHWHTIQEAGKSTQPTKKNSDGRQKAVDLWRRLPLPLANFLGPQLRKFISL